MSKKDKITKLELALKKNLRKRKIFQKKKEKFSKKKLVKGKANDHSIR